MLEGIIFGVFEIVIGGTILICLEKFFIPFLRKRIKEKRKKQILTFVLKG